MKKITNIKDDGLGYDEKRKQYFMVCYAWKYLTKENNRSKNLIIKSGITKHNVNHAMKASTPTRGKMHPTQSIYGFDSDRFYLPKGISKIKAAKIVNKTDRLFKDTMEDLGLVYKQQVNINGLGTEFYRGNKDEIVNLTIKEWKNSFASAQMLILNKVSKNKLKQIQYRGEQWMHPIMIENYLSQFDFGRVIAPCGSGKTIRMFTDININTFFKNKKVNVLYGPKIAATQQLAIRFSQYAEDTAFDGIWKSVVVCSDPKRNKDYEYYGIEAVSASDTNLELILEQAFTSSEKYLFFVNMKSAKAFWNLYYKIAKKFSFNELPGVIYDEVHRYSGNKSKDNTQCVIKAKTDCSLSYTATPKVAPIKRNKDYIYNDDEKYFGKIALEILPQDAIDQGLNSEILFKIIEVWDDSDLGKEIFANKEIGIKFKRKSIEIKGNLLKIIPAIISEINDGKTHIYIPTSRKQNVVDAINFIELCQKYGFISNEYKLVSGLITDGKKAFEQFEKYKKAIIISTRWSIESLDYPCIKSIIPMNNFSSLIDADQTIGRGQRPFNDEVLHVCISVNPLDKNNSLLEVAHNKIINSNTIVKDSKLIEDVSFSKIKKALGSKQNAHIKVQHQKDPSTPPTFRVMMDDIVDSIGTEEFGNLYKSWKAKKYSDEQIIESAAPHGSPYKWKCADESIYYHAYYRREHDDIWDRATKHMEHRTLIDVDKRMDELFKAIDKCKGKEWAMKTFTEKYPKLLGWLKSNPKAVQPKIWDGKVVDMSILPFVPGRFGHITKEYLLETKIGCETMTDWSNKIGYSNQNTLQKKCKSLKVEYKSLLLTKKEAARRNGALSTKKKK